MATVSLVSSEVLTTNLTGVHRMVHIGVVGPYLPSGIALSTALAEIFFRVHRIECRYECR